MNPPQTVAASVAPFAQRSSSTSRASLRRIRSWQRFIGAGLVGATALLWLWSLNVQKFPSVAIIPLLVMATAPAVFARRPWLSLLPRVALWGTLLWGGFGASITHSSEKEHTPLVVLTVAAAVALISLGRFARSIGAMRPLLAALVTLAIADAIATGLFAAFIAVDMLSHDRRPELDVVGVFLFAAAANAAGVWFMVRSRNYAPHLVGNALIILVNLIDPAKLHEAKWFIIGPAVLQVLLTVVAQRLPRASSRGRRNAEHAMRLALVGGALFVCSTYLWR